MKQKSLKGDSQKTFNRIDLFAVYILADCKNR